jgi:hypothetical protein
MIYCQNCGQDTGKLTEVWGTDGSMNLGPCCYDPDVWPKCANCGLHVWHELRDDNGLCTGCTDEDGEDDEDA